MKVHLSGGVVDDKNFELRVDGRILTVKTDREVVGVTSYIEQELVAITIGDEDNLEDDFVLNLTQNQAIRLRELLNDSILKA